MEDLEYMGICQSCAFPMTEPAHYGNEADGSLANDYCRHCYKNGAFTSNETMEQMVETCIPFSINEGVYHDADTARAAMMEYFPTLKRWA